jgi:hypothetical protein
MRKSTERKMAMSTQKVVVGGSSVTASQLKDLFRQIEDGSIGGEHLQAFLEHRDSWLKRWTVKDGVIYFTLISNGFTGDEWITHLNGKKQPVGPYAQSVLRHPNFKPTKAGTPHHIAVLLGKLYFDDERITRNIRTDAKKRKMTDPHAEVACLIRDAFTDQEIEEMGLTWIITMHEPIPDSDGHPHLLGADRYGGYRLSAYDSRPDDRWSRARGFAFSVAQGA